ncbi:SSI family serine proteinase inhibitor [Actinomadura kijaniata]|uniref:SSI family serine proteinase inhibitor n=1 Tax=Actinomadura kijaniata TaxID=46161 RepID=UPI003F1A21E5
MSVSRAVRWAVTAAALVPLTAVPAAADPRPAGPEGAYLLMVTPVGEAAPERSATLWCGPDGGAHPVAENACDQLRKVSGRIGEIPEQQGPCTLEYRPVRLTATGHWRGAPRHFDRTYPNRCAAVRGTGGTLFAF